jgi:hypothetical protein
MSPALIFVGTFGFSLFNAIWTRTAWVRLFHVGMVGASLSAILFVVFA